MKVYYKATAMIFWEQKQTDRQTDTFPDIKMFTKPPYAAYGKTQAKCVPPRCSAMCSD